MDPLKNWILDQMKAEEGKGQTARWWKLKHYADRVSMAEFESTRLQYTANADKKAVYDELVAPIKEEIKFWEKK